MQGTLRVYGVQEPVAVATSMAINASNANPWAEGVRYFFIHAAGSLFIGDDCFAPFGCCSLVELNDALGGFTLS